MMDLPSYATDAPSFPQLYEHWLVGALFRPWAELTVAELGLAPGDAVLDIACGTGIAARVARQRLRAGSHVVGVDANPGMLAMARTLAPNIDWREGQAGGLPLNPAETFNAVICQQGLQFFPDKPAAAAQMRRALAPGGKLAVSTWRSDDEQPPALALRRAAERHLGPIADPRYSFGDAGSLERLLRDAGFADVQVRERSHAVQFDGGGQAFVRLNAMALIGMSAIGKTIGGDERQRLLNAIVIDSAPALSEYSHGPLTFETKSNVATARA